MIAEGRRFNPGRRLMAAGSWPRLIVGLVLALEVVRMQFAGGTSLVALALAAIFILLTIAYVLFRF